MARIEFGTDGWRAVISEDFTFDNVRIVSQAIADYLKAGGRARGLRIRVIVGYDTRFLSDRYGQIVAEVLAGNGIGVILTSSATPIPAVTFAIKHMKAAGGVMITASHNPPQYNGIKFKPEYAGPATTEITSKIEGYLGERRPRQMSFEEGIKKGLIQVLDISEPYIKYVKSYVKMKALKGTGLTVVLDSMHGATKDYVARILTDTNCRVATIRQEENPSFGGHNPEPILENLAPLVDKVRELGADVGFATDGDGDRLGVIGPDGRFVNPHKVLSLLTSYLIESRGWSGKLAKTISTSSLMDRIANKYGRQLYETPVGFKHICELMLAEDILIGGEESGGIGFKNHIHDRDGILSILLLLEMLTLSKKGLLELLEEMREEFGDFFSRRIDTDYPISKHDILTPTLSARPPKQLAGIPISRVDNRDGVKFRLADGSWLLIRPSGTEPIIRIYAESNSQKKVDRIIEAGKKLAFSI